VPARALDCHGNRRAIPRAIHIGGGMRIPSNIAKLFAGAGWMPGRKVAVDPEVPESHPAHAILAEFGGLHVGIPGADGEEIARSDIEICYVAESEPTVTAWEKVLGTELIGIGRVHNGHVELYISGAGRIFTCSGVHKAFMFEGTSFGEAAEGILSGRKAKLMLLPDKSSVRLFGDDFRVGDPRVISQPYALAR
jgi:hypothetical protein